MAGLAEAASIIDAAGDDWSELGWKQHQVDTAVSSCKLDMLGKLSKRGTLNTKAIAAT